MEREVFNEKMEMIAGQLGYTWQPDDTWANHGYLIGQDHVKISVRNDDYPHRGRIEFSSVYPIGRSGCYFTRNHVAITVAETKTPEQIAGDLQKRFLPTYRDNLKKVLAANQDFDDYEARKVATLKTVADYLGEEIRDNRCIYPIINEIYNIENDGDKFVRIVIHQCTPEKAIEIIKVLRL